ncbi:PLP-dependent aminotransferase family protein [Marinobacterium aestuariivivens]|uniref:PLP-dependent aminotransferase family protein n=1 Tax=Marinobacterium aestuariivivens TaxID=1698799 RepID=A0ABW2A1Q4_9GAMM
MKIYEQTAQLLREQILSQQLRPGDPLPSIRELSARLKIGRNSVIHAYMLLEDEELIEPRPRSGYFVRPRPASLPDDRTPQPRKVELGAMALDIIGAAENARLVPLGSADPDARCAARQYFYRRLSLHARQAASLDQSNSHYIAPPGHRELRRQLARRHQPFQPGLGADDIVITNGAQEAVTLALLTLARPGDIVAVESPCFYGTLQCIEALGLQALEIPGHPQHGLDLGALHQALERWPVKALLTNPSFNNPTGACMPDAAKPELLKLAAQYDLPIIEDDVFGELSHQGSRPLPVKAFDRDGRVLLCSSLSKTLDSDIRIGWMLPGRYFEQVNYLKYVTTLASPAWCSRPPPTFSPTTATSVTCGRSGAVTSSAWSCCSKPCIATGRPKPSRWFPAAASSAGSSCPEAATATASTATPSRPVSASPREACSPRTSAIVTASGSITAPSTTARSIAMRSERWAS